MKPVRPLPPRARRAAVLAIASLLAVVLVPGPPSARGQEKAKEREAEKKAAQTKISEEIEVVGKAPKDQPVSTVTRLDFTRIERNRPIDLSEALRYAPGVSLTVGSKFESTLKIRGMDARRIALLIDGVPSYEPYYGSFDLKTVSAAGLDSIQITRGPSSVLYGPNTLGGIVNVVTRRPGSEPSLDLTGSYGERNTRSAGLEGGAQWGKFAFSGVGAYQGSDGFAYPDPATGSPVGWMNTDYRRVQVGGKAYFLPSPGTELMVGGNVYTSEYGLPPSLGVQKARYWHFKNWDRYALNAGGFTSLGGSATLRFRGFYVNYRNTLDQYKDPAMSLRQFESSFDNSVYGGFALAEIPLARANSLKASLDYQRDVARIQDDVNLPWSSFKQGTLSAAVEDHLALGDRWELVGGLSLDVIEKNSGGSETRLNPLAGIKFTPREDLDVHVSISRKSRFPNMRSLYSPSSGNPGLLSETGTNAEIGIAWSGAITLAGSVFAYEFRDMIDTVTRPDGTKWNFNVGRARINGFELQAAKSWGWLEASAGYTFLDHENEVDRRPLDAQPKHNLSFEASLRPLSRLRLAVFGIYASASWWYDFSAARLLDIPGYFNLDAVVSYDVGRAEIFLKAANVFDAYIYTEPIFPWRGRFFELGVRVRVF